MAGWGEWMGTAPSLPSAGFHTAQRWPCKGLGFLAGPTLQKGLGTAMIRGGHASTEETHVLPVRPTLDVVPTLPHSSPTVGSEASQ